MGAVFDLLHGDETALPFLERGLLGTLLIRPDWLPLVADVQIRHFSDVRRGAVLEALRAVPAVDFAGILVARGLERRDIALPFGARTWLSWLAETFDWACVDEEELQEYARTLRRETALRRADAREGSRASG